MNLPMRGIDWDEDKNRASAHQQKKEPCRNEKRGLRRNRRVATRSHGGTESREEVVIDVNGAKESSNARTEVYSTEQLTGYR